MTAPVRAAYDQLIAAHELKPDAAQARAVAALDRLAASLENGDSCRGYSGPAAKVRLASISGAVSGGASRC